MKKILGVVLASALVAGAFAQVTTGVEFRTKVTAADWTFKKDTDPDAAYFAQDNLDDTHIGVTAAGKNAGVTAEVTFDLNNALTLNGKDYSFIGDINGDGVTDEKDKLALSKDPLLAAGDVLGWFNIGGLKFTAGKFASRSTNAMGLRMRQSVGKIVSISFVEAYKFGTAIEKNVGVDANNMTHGTNLAAIGDYTFPIGDAKLLVKAAIFDSDPGFPHLKSGYGFEAAYQSKLFTIIADVKVPKAYTAVTGVYFRMMPINMLDFAVGGTLAFDNSGTTDNTTIGLDARVRILPLDALSFTVMGNYSLETAKQGDNKAYTDGKYIALNASYMLNDMFTLFGELGYFDENTKAYKEKDNIKFQVGTTINPVENVTVSGAVQAAIPIYSDTPAKGTPVFGLSIPVAMKIAF
ncbi:hypothetical protein [Treponema socranskii]|uniref:hypothetical protein n=1 Tax=Treponema socranskii TaxID=53419 RepID=UPI0028714109|nr:hypothetical protein [Treponema socranskii]MDR9858809.1 hypothetical protein [Treponema socranskii]